MKENILSDPFLVSRLNPLFLQQLQALATQENIDSLILFAFRKLLQPIYLKYNTPNKGTLFFLSTISSDGIGDYVALHKSAELAREHFPTLDIKVGYTFQRLLPSWSNALPTFSFEDPDYLIEKIIDGNSLPEYASELQEAERELAKNIADYEEIKMKSPIAAEAMEEYILDLEQKTERFKRNAHIQQRGNDFYKELIAARGIINISLAMNTFENPLLTQKSLYFSETGNFQGITYAEKLNWYSMGLLPLEEGIFLKQSLSKETTTEYLCYITTLSNAKLCYIYLIAELEKKKSSDITLILLPLSIEEIANLDHAYLQQLGISRIIIDEMPIEIGSAGKTLHLRQKLPLPYAEFLQQMNISQNPIGCTGDLSLSETIALEKIPFYEARPHKAETIDSLIYLSNALKLSNVERYFSALKNIEHPQTAARELATLICSDAFIAEWETLLTYIRRYYCFEDSLLATLKSFLAYQDKPGWKQEERAMILSGQDTEEIYAKIAAKIKTAS